MSRTINTTSSITINPSGYTNTATISVYSSYPYSNAYSDINSTTYALFWTSTRSTTGRIDYTFDTSAIPTGSGVTIDSVNAQVRARLASTSSSNRADFQLYSGASTAKGSYTRVSSTTSTTYTLTAGTWTRDELNDLRLRISPYTTSSNSSRSTRFYGANITINYSTSVTAYTIAASSLVAGTTVSPSSQELYEGEDGDVTITTSDITSIIVTDNGNDVTNQLVEHTATPGTFTTTYIPSSFDEDNSLYVSTYSTNYTSNGLTNHTSTTRCALYARTGSGQTSVMYYNFDCSNIPENAIINSVSCQFKGGTQGSSYYSSYTAQLTSGTTAKGTATSVTGSNSSPSTVTISGGSNWTRAELDDIKIKFQVVRGSSNTTTDATWSFFGATLTINYTVPGGTYYTYEIYNIDDDHVIVVEEPTVYIPPEEDPTETYWPITISSINATTSPPNGTIRVIEGTNHTITITPSDPQLTLALDNGVNITNQLVASVPTNSYTVTTQVSGASYGFNLNNNTGYYVSTNNGVAKSASVARLNLDFESSCLVTIQYINYAEANYDYGLFGKLDTAVATDGLTASSGSSSPSDSTSNYQLAMASNSSSAQTITYDVPAGQHFIDIKYGKDDGTNSNNDTLQWKVLSIEATSAGGDYTYTLTNVTQKHSLIFVFGNVNFYYITSSGPNDIRLFPDGQIVVLENDNYKINIVPNNVNANVGITDNGVNTTSQLVQYTGVDKNNNPVVSYTYTLYNIQATHTLVISGGGSTAQIYIKQNGTWVAYSKVYKKINGSWVEQSDLSSVFSTTANYVKSN